MSVRPAAWNNPAAPEWVFIKFGIEVVFKIVFEKIEISLKPDKRNRYFTL
jgi:hypothetical protein